MIATTAAEKWVSTGQKSLGSWWGSNYPWYDASQDDIRAIHALLPRENTAKPWILHLPTIPLESLSYPVLVILGSIAAYLVIRYFRQRKDALPKEQAPAVAIASPVIDALPTDVRHARENLLAEAQRLAEQRNFSRAILFLFAHQLVQLDQHQAIHFVRSKTNRQYLRELKPRQELQRLFEHTMLLFEDVFFGGRTIQQARFESCWSELPRFEELLLQEVKP